MLMQKIELKSQPATREIKTTNYSNTGAKQVGITNLNFHFIKIRTI